MHVALINATEKEAVRTNLNKLRIFFCVIIRYLTFHKALNYRLDHCSGDVYRLAICAAQPFPLLFKHGFIEKKITMRPGRAPWHSAVQCLCCSKQAQGEHLLSWLPIYSLKKKKKDNFPRERLHTCINKSRNVGRTQRLRKGPPQVNSSRQIYHQGRAIVKQGAALRKPRKRV